MKPPSHIYSSTCTTIWALFNVDDFIAVKECVSYCSSLFSSKLTDIHTVEMCFELLPEVVISERSDKVAARWNSRVRGGKVQIILNLCRYFFHNFQFSGYLQIPPTLRRKSHFHQILRKKFATNINFRRNF